MASNKSTIQFHVPEPTLRRLPWYLASVKLPPRFQPQLVGSKGDRKEVFTGGVHEMTFSNGQPSPSTREPAGVSGHLSLSSVTPSSSVSRWDAEQPLASTASPAGVAGH